MSPKSNKKTELRGEPLRHSLETILQSGEPTQAAAQLAALIEKILDRNDQLEHRLALLLRNRFGRSSERISPDQLALFASAEVSANDDGEAKAAPEQQETEKPKRKWKRTGRKALPADLERVEHVLEPKATDKHCEACDCPKVQIGAETSSVLEFEPSQMKVHVYTRPKFACGKCKSGVSIAPAADKPLDGGLPGPGLLAQVMVSKFKDHLPLHRLAGIFERHGVEIARSTLGSWVEQCSDMVAPLVELIRKRALAAHVLQCDDTKLTVLDKSKEHGSKKGHMWCLLGDQKFAFFAYTETWRGEEARKLIAERQSGLFQIDGYAGFDERLSMPNNKLIEAGCWSHARRKFFEAHDKKKDPRAAKMLFLIGVLFDVERDAKERGLDAPGRLALRKERSVNALKKIDETAATYRTEALPKSPLGKALTYLKNQRMQLGRFLEDGAVEIHNNAAERALRAIALGRNNWKHAGSDAGARRAAAFYTLIATAVLHGAEPWAYLRDVFSKLGGDFPARRLDELLPARWLELHATR